MTTATANGRTARRIPSSAATTATARVPSHHPHTNHPANGTTTQGTTASTVAHPGDHRASSTPTTTAVPASRVTVSETAGHDAPSQPTLYRGVISRNAP